jgi:hypothetical protein
MSEARSEKVDQAQSEIERILGNLERSTNCVVESIDICAIDVTTMGDTARRVLRHVQIQLRDPPGYGWASGSGEIAGKNSGQKPLSY